MSIPYKVNTYSFLLFFPFFLLEKALVEKCTLSWAVASIGAVLIGLRESLVHVAKIPRSGTWHALWQPLFRFDFQILSIPPSPSEPSQVCGPKIYITSSKLLSLVRSGPRNQTQISDQLAWHWTMTSFNCAEQCPVENTAAATDVLRSCFLFPAPLHHRCIVCTKV